jgi:hypothetical protein
MYCFNLTPILLTCYAEIHADDPQISSSIYGLKICIKLIVMSYNTILQHFVPTSHSCMPQLHVSVQLAIFRCRSWSFKANATVVEYFKLVLWCSHTRVQLEVLLLELSCFGVQQSHINLIFLDG